MKIKPSRARCSKEDKFALETSTEIPDNFDFNVEFQDAFNMMENTQNHLFVTGKAGTGKSTLLEYFKMNTKKKIAVLAPTGVAAIKIHGQTIHSFFKLPSKFIQQENIRRLKNSKLFENLDAIVIDEASMVRADILDGIDYSLRINTNNHNVPFGGVQIILFGDLFQLPPVVNSQIKEIMDSLYDSPYFFSAHVLKDIKMENIELSKVYRQKDSVFIDLLNKIRVKDVKRADIKKLNSRVSIDSRCSKGVITLTTTNKSANVINDKHLLALHKKEYSYDAQVGGSFDGKAAPAELCLNLKLGAQVMLLKNDAEKRWVNGTIAEVAELSGSAIKVKINNEIYKVPNNTWEKIEYKYDDKEKKITEKIVGSFKQFPIKLAWAITIHKSQGQTFQNVVIDMGYGAFTHGQTYVALSRCTSLEGIVLKRPIIHSDIILDDRIYGLIAKDETVCEVPAKEINPFDEPHQEIFLDRDIEHRPIRINKLDEQVKLTYDREAYDEQFCCFDIYVENDIVKERVFKLHKWAHSKVEAEPSHRKIRELSDSNLQLKIKGEGIDGRCRWCRTFRTGLKTACENDFGVGTFSQEGYCRFES